MDPPASMSQSLVEPTSPPSRDTISASSPKPLILEARALNCSLSFTESTVDGVGKYSALIGPVADVRGVYGVCISS